MEDKFRVFCEKHNRWEVYTLGDLVVGNATSDNGEGGIFKGNTWCRFIGTRGMAGEDIYENDVVEIDGCRYWIVWDQDFCRFGKWLLDEAGVPECGGIEDIEEALAWDYKVVGNIFDNPELVKKS